MRHWRTIALVSSCVTLIAVTGCGGSATQRPQSIYEGAYLYGADGNMSNPFGALFEKYPGVLSGMKGTRPMTALSDDFKARLAAVDSHLPDYNYAGEAYDAVVISALAAQVAGSTDAKSIAAQINGVTIGDEPCTSVASCLDKARQGVDVAYRGVTVRSGFTDAGEPSTTSYGTVHFGPFNQLDQGKTEFLRAGNEANATKAAPKTSNGAKTTGPLILGALMTAPSATSVTSAARFAGARLAIKEINAAGGVLGQPVQWREGSDGADAKVAASQIAAHRAAGVQVLIGTSGSGVGQTVLPQVIEAGMIMFSPSATAAALSTVDDKGLYFRTAPSDVLQARALADMIMRDGDRNVVLIGKNDAYGTGLVNGVKRELLAAGLPDSAIHSVLFDIEGGKIKDPGQLTTLARQTVNSRPDGVLVVGTTESAEMIKALADAQLIIRH
jgi:ABC-type branched-subunit amino acid transport system substrate-binding protein